MMLSSHERETLTGYIPSAHATYLTTQTGDWSALSTGVMIGLRYTGDMVGVIPLGLSDRAIYTGDWSALSTGVMIGLSILATGRRYLLGL